MPWRPIYEETFHCTVILKTPKSNYKDNGASTVYWFFRQGNSRIYFAQPMTRVKIKF